MFNKCHKYVHSCQLDGVFLLQNLAFEKKCVFPIQFFSQASIFNFVFLGFSQNLSMAFRPTARIHLNQIFFFENRLRGGGSNTWG